MGTLTSRGRAALIAAFLASAGLFAVAAVALVANSDHDRTNGSLPRVNPTLIAPSTSPTPEATPTTDGTASPTATPSTSATASPAATATRRPTGGGSSVGTTGGSSGATTGKVVTQDVEASASVDPSSGATTTATIFKLIAHATDSQGTFRRLVINWGDGTPVETKSGAECSHAVGGDCRNWAAQHKYNSTGSYTITVTVYSDGAVDESLIMRLPVNVETVAPTPTPTATP